MAAIWEDIKRPQNSVIAVTAAQVANGPVIPPQQRLLTYSPDEWESFVEEWAYYCLATKYKHIQRFSGAGDMGIDVAGFVDAKRLQGVWDNYQCKHYDHAIRPSDVWAEFGKVIWHSYKGEFTVPRRYYFVSPRGAGTSLSRLFANATKLREELIANWDKHVKEAITSTQEVSLDGKLRAYVDTFNFSIFDAKTALQLVDDHRTTPVHAARFGGGLPTRPTSESPPQEVTVAESRYVTQLLGAYGEHMGAVITTPSALSTSKLKDHFRRQREAFYEAESLRVFARDSVPPGTFESLLDDIHGGVIDTCDANHTDGYEKVCAVTKAARDMQITANALITCTKPKDRDGICHQLVNEERLRWTRS
ncbi:ABC-three component system protein [Undibacterium sp. SXout7W]|uniref:ABC-three component system protein n=1 Tax=Undibacterium sp. SXout7W TaxID=3413049 RepID=UPI003BF42A7A